MKPLLISLLLVHSCFAQPDTVRIDLRHTSLSLHKCRGVLFDDHWGNTFSYPPTNQITYVDSTFLYNPDTVCFHISRGKRLLMEGQKLPGIEAFGIVRFYRRNRLVRTEEWVQECCFERGEDTTECWSDEPMWIAKTIYRRGRVAKQFVKALELSPTNGFCLKTIRRKRTHNREKVTRCECVL